MTQETKASKKPKTAYLEPDEENRLFVEFGELRAAYSETGDEKCLKRMDQIRSRICKAFERLVIKRARSLSGYNTVPFDHLVGEGTVALNEAIDKFDMSRGWKFATLADHLVRYKMFNFVSENFSVVNVCKTTSNKRLFYSLRKEIVNKIKREGHFVMTDLFAEEMAEKFNCSIDDVHSMNSVLIGGDLSTSTPMGDEESGSSTYEDFLISNDEPADELLINDQQVFMHQDIIDTCIERSLTEREADIYRRRVLTDEPQTLEMIASRYNLSRERIRQLESRAREKVERTVPIVMNELRIRPMDLF